MAWPSPRTWEMGARLLAYAAAAGVKAGGRQRLLSGAVGGSAAREFLAWERGMLYARSAEEMKESVLAVVAYIKGEIAARRANPGNDFIGHVLRAEIDGRKRLSCQLYQRSADVFLGVPFNIASYALLTMMIAQVCDLKPGDFVHTFGDTHLYLNHLDQAEEQLSRRPFPLPTMRLNPAVQDIFAFQYGDFELLNYQSHGKIAAPIAGLQKSPPQMELE